jgi:hypothetical protein
MFGGFYHVVFKHICVGYFDPLSPSWSPLHRDTSDLSDRLHVIPKNVLLFWSCLSSLNDFPTQMIFLEKLLWIWILCIHCTGMILHTSSFPDANCNDCFHPLCDTPENDKGV